MTFVVITAYYFNSFVPCVKETLTSRPQSTTVELVVKECVEGAVATPYLSLGGAGAKTL